MLELNTSETHLYRLLDFFSSEDGLAFIDCLKDEVNNCSSLISQKALKIDKKEQFDDFISYKKFLEGKQEAFNDLINRLSEISLKEDLEMLKRQALRKA